jgi:anti-sigma-K factor RskA
MDERLEELFPFYALDALTAEERAQVDAYVAADADARTRLNEAIRAATALPYEAQPIVPRAQIKQDVLKRVKANAPSRPDPTWMSFSAKVAQFLDWPAWRIAMPLVAAASLIVAILIGVWAASLNNEVNRLLVEQATLQRELLTQREVLAQIALPQTQAMAIAGTQVQPNAYGQMIANPDGNSGVLIVADLAPLPPGKVYQFWLIKDNTPVSAGLFSVDAQGRGLLPVRASEPVGSFDAIGVSIEPEGGSPQPTGDIVMLSKLSGS